MGIDHIRELLSGRRSSRLVLVVSDLVSDLDVLVFSVVGLTQSQSSPWMNGSSYWRFSQSVLNIRPLPWLARALLPVGHGWDGSQTCF